MGSLTVSCPLAALGPDIVNKKNRHEILYKEIMKTLDDDDVCGIQLYPAGWPRKVQITVNDATIKEKLVIEGLNMFDKHVDMRDESNLLVKVILKDAPLEWPNDTVTEIFEEYGDVIRIEHEYIYVDGAKTTCCNGNRQIYLAKLNSRVPPTMTVTINERTLTLCTWYRGQDTDNEQEKSCFHCGADGHGTKQCQFKHKVCYICHDPSHNKKDCPRNDGSKFTESTILFLNSKSAFSNWNVDYPFVVDDIKYSCVEQYCMKKKCELFGDKVAENKVMKETVPRDMKSVGDRIKDYDHRVWVDVQQEVVSEGVKAKFIQNLDAREELLNTGNKLIGEATTNKMWGIGVHISDSRCLHSANWVGENVMGKVLMGVRDELKQCDDVMESLLDTLGQSSNEIKQKEKNVHEGGDKRDERKDSHNDSLEGDHGSDNGDSENDSVEIELPWAVLLGDSNVTGMRFEGEDIPVHVEVIAEGGSKLEHIRTKIEQCELNSEDVRVVAIHAGTCEWSANAAQPASADVVYRTYIETLNVISDKYRNAEIVISSVPPRASKGQNKGKAEMINVQIQELNKKLVQLSTDEENILFVDNDIF